MNVSAPWIRRPVATTLIAIGILLVGIVAYVRLPIAALPSVDRPTIALWAGLPGASADTIASALAQPLERQIGTIPGIVEMRSFSATGGTELTVQFQLDKNIDAAAGAIQAAINAAGPSLPKDLPSPPGYWKANPSGWSVITLALTSEVLDPSDVYDVADTIVAEQISQVPGVAQVYDQRRRARRGAHPRGSGPDRRDACVARTDPRGGARCDAQPAEGHG